jgi:hypothetical protein
MADVANAPKSVAPPIAVAVHGFERLKAFAIHAAPTPEAIPPIIGVVVEAFEYTVG